MEPGGPGPAASPGYDQSQEIPACGLLDLGPARTVRNSLRLRCDGEG